MLKLPPLKKRSNKNFYEETSSFPMFIKREYAERPERIKEEEGRGEYIPII
jgi:hypothetical protein